MPTDAEVIARFYAAFARGDAEAMAACYAPTATFTDPVFPHLADGEPGDMWRMLLARGGDLAVELVSSDADSAHWIARYTFTQTGRPVVNDVRSHLRLVDGQIVEQADRFSFWRWSRQALGMPGLLLGWTPLLQRKVQATARASLETFRAQQ